MADDRKMDLDLPPPYRTPEQQWARVRKGYSDRNAIVPVGYPSNWLFSSKKIDVTPMFVWFNWDASEQKDASVCALNLGSYEASQGFSVVDGPEFRPVGNAPAAYSIADVKTGNGPVIHATFHAIDQATGDPYQGQALIGAAAANDGNFNNILGWIPPQVVDFNSDGNSDLAVFQLEHHHIGKGGVFGVRAGFHAWLWAASTSGSTDPGSYTEGDLNKKPFQITNMTTHEIFVLADRPQAPWSEFPPKDQLFRLPCVQLLRAVLGALVTPKDLSSGEMQTWVVSAIAQWLHPSGPVDNETGHIDNPLNFTYSRDSQGLTGAGENKPPPTKPVIALLSIPSLLLRISMDAPKDPGLPANQCSCFTPSFVLCACARALGCQTTLVRIQPNEILVCHPLIPLGSDRWLTRWDETQDGLSYTDGVDPTTTFVDPTTTFQQVAKVGEHIIFGDHRIVAVGDFERYGSSASPHFPLSFNPIVVDATFRANASMVGMTDGTGATIWAPIGPTVEVPWDSTIAKKTYLCLRLRSGLAQVAWPGYCDYVLFDAAQPLLLIFDKLELSGVKLEIAGPP